MIGVLPFPVVALLDLAAGFEADQVLSGIHQELPVVIETVALPVVGHLTDGLLLHGEGIGNVEHGQLEAQGLAGLFIHVPAYAQKLLLAPEVQVVREARDLELAQKLWRLWIADVNGEEGIRIAEGDQVEDVIQEAGALD